MKLNQSDRQKVDAGPMYLEVIMIVVAEFLEISELIVPLPKRYIADLENRKNSTKVNQLQV